MVQDAACIAHAVWRETDFDKISSSRNLKDEFASRIATAAYTDSAASFLDRLLDRWGVRSLSNDAYDAEEVRDLVNRYDAEGDARRFLRTVRNNAALVVLEMQHEYLN